LCRAVKDQDVDEAHGKNGGVYSKSGELHVDKKRFVIFRDEEVGGLGMATTDEDRRTARTLNRDQFKMIRRLKGSNNF